MSMESKCHQRDIDQITYLLQTALKKKKKKRIQGSMSDNSAVSNIDKIYISILKPYHASLTDKNNAC